MEHENDQRINISKKIKYGYRYYYIIFHIDEAEEENNQFGRYSVSDSVEIIIDNRNNCVEFIHSSGMENIIYEDIEFVKKWSEILEEYINKDINNKTKEAIEKTLTSCFNKDILRAYQLKKLL